MIHIEYIDKLSSIAKLNMSKAEKEAFIEHMENLIDYAEILNEVDIDNEMLLEDIENEGTPLRNDEIQTSYTRESLLKNAPKTENGYFMVPNSMI